MDIGQISHFWTGTNYLSMSFIGVSKRNQYIGVRNFECSVMTKIGKKYYHLFRHDWNKW